MTYAQINNMIAGMGLDYAYYQFSEATKTAPPFICFFYSGIDDLYADETNYQRIVSLIVELYTDTKDFALESRVESVLSANGLTYRKTETYIDTEHMHQTVYEMGVLINGEQS